MAHRKARSRHQAKLSDSGRDQGWRLSSDDWHREGGLFTSGAARFAREFLKWEAAGFPMAKKSEVDAALVALRNGILTLVDCETIDAFAAAHVGYEEHVAHLEDVADKDRETVNVARQFVHGAASVLLMVAEAANLPLRGCFPREAIDNAREPLIPLPAPNAENN